MMRNTIPSIETIKWYTIFRAFAKSDHGFSAKRANISHIYCIMGFSNVPVMPIDTHRAQAIGNSAPQSAIKALEPFVPR